MGSLIVAAGGNGSDGGKLLNRRGFKGLSEGINRKVYSREALPSVYDSACLAGQVNAGNGGISEGLKIIVESVRIR